MRIARSGSVPLYYILETFSEFTEPLLQLQTAVKSVVFWNACVHITWSRKDLDTWKSRGHKEVWIPGSPKLTSIAIEQKIKHQCYSGVCWATTVFDKPGSSCPRFKFKEEWSVMVCLLSLVLWVDTGLTILHVCFVPLLPFVYKVFRAHIILDSFAHKTSWPIRSRKLLVKAPQQSSLFKVINVFSWSCASHKFRQVGSSRIFKHEAIYCCSLRKYHKHSSDLNRDLLPQCKCEAAYPSWSLCSNPKMACPDKQ